MISFSYPIYLYLIPLTYLTIVFTFFRTKRNIRSLLLRALSLTIILLALSDPFFTNSSDKKTQDQIIALIDNSKSMTKNAIEDCNKQIELNSNNSVKIKKIQFANGIKEKDGNTAADNELTNYQDTLIEIAKFYPETDLVICTDGQETAGNIENIAKNFNQTFKSISLIFPDALTLNSESIELSNINLPLEAKSSDNIFLSFTIKNKTKKIFNQVLEINSDLTKIKDVSIKLAEFEEKKLEIPLQKLEKGEHKISVKNSNSTLGARWIKINEPPSLIVISRPESSVTLIQKILETLKINFKVVNPNNILISELEGSLNSGIILNNVRASDLNNQTQTEIGKFVEGGGGLLILGGDSSFGLGGYQKTILDTISPLKSVPPRSKIARAPSAVMLVVDKSGSMGEQSKLHSAKLAALSAIYSLKPNDYVGMVGFDYAPLSIIELDLVEKVRLNAKERLANLSAYGQTNLLPALSLARLRLSKINAGKKHLIILSDGQFPAQSDAFVAEINRLRTEGITISTVALGYEADGPFMKMLAQAGKGSFYQTVDASNLPKLFVDDIKLAVGEDTMKEDDSFKVQLGKDSSEISKFGTPPDLLGFVETEAKENIKLELSVSKSNSLFPLLGSWNYGKGRVSAFSSDLQSRWSSPWLKWSEFLNFWENVLRKTLKSDNSDVNNKHFDLRYEVVGRKLKLESFIYDQYLENGLGNSILTEISYKGKSLGKINLLEQAKGRFENSISLSEAGDYDITFDLGKKRNYKVAILEKDLGEITKGVDFEFLNNFSSKLNATLGKFEINDSPKKISQSPLRSKPIVLELLIFAMILIFSEVFIRERTKSR